MTTRAIRAEIAWGFQEAWRGIVYHACGHDRTHYVTNQGAALEPVEAYIRRQEQAPCMSCRRRR